MPPDSPSTASLGGEPDAAAKGTNLLSRAGELPLGDRKPPQAPAKADRGAVIALNPHALAAARAEAARKTKIERDKYQTVRSLDQLKAWIARIHDVGHVAIDAKATSIDPMQAEMCGVALALGSNDACYIPLSHKQSGDGAGLFAAGLAPDQIKAADALEALRPLLESRGVLKIGFNIKFTAVMLAQHSIVLQNHDDVQLMSYALDAGRNSHGLDALSESRLGHAVLSHGEVTGTGKNKLSFDQVAIDRATAYSAEDADVI
jgi:DNA polymerase-1